VGERNQVAGKRFLEAVVVGYEIGIRMGVIANTGYENRFCGSGNWSSFGATAAVSKLTNLSNEECSNALGICEAHSPMAPMGWMFSGDYSMIKEAIGWGAFTGVSSALLAQRGMTGIFAFADDYEAVINTLGR
jgi:2-methylcitrate dehydratase PrpD